MQTVIVIYGSAFYYSCQNSGELEEFDLIYLYVYVISFHMHNITQNFNSPDPKGHVSFCHQLASLLFVHKPCKYFDPLL